jgi:hypothetical protein
LSPPSLRGPFRHGATEFNAIGAMLEILMRQPERPDDADNPPRYWQVINQLPRTPAARIAKHRLPEGHQPGEYDADA